MSASSDHSRPSHWKQHVFSKDFPRQLRTVCCHIPDRSEIQGYRAFCISPVDPLERMLTLWDDAFSSFLDGIRVHAANASVMEPNMAYGEIGQGLEFGVQLIYLGALLALLGVGSFLAVRQVLVRRELESAAKDLQVRTTTLRCVSYTKIFVCCSLSINLIST